jgi:hypothetical protein
MCECFFQKGLSQDVHGRNGRKQALFMENRILTASKTHACSEKGHASPAKACACVADAYAFAAVVCVSGTKAWALPALDSADFPIKVVTASKSAFPKARGIDKLGSRIPCPPFP